jgi:two-component system, chemotaxis family, response regulator Rcp1
MNDQAATERIFEFLLIEDNPGDIRLTREALQGGGISHRLSVVSDGDRALDFLHQRNHFQDAVRPDLIILDLNLPRRSGIEVLADIKSDPELCRIPVIIFTSSKSDREIDRSYELHANCYITKPVGLDRFMEVVRSIEQFWLGVVHLPAR